MLSKAINIIGITPVGTLRLQAEPNVAFLHDQLSRYFQRTILRDAKALYDVPALQKFLNVPANTIDELIMYSFEDNQRVSEVATVLAISHSINRLRQTSFIPVWQLPGQGSIMQKFSDKGSWDGLILEISSDQSLAVSPIPIEIKSLMVNPNDKLISPNQQLRDRLPKYKKHFQKEGSVCALLIMPYTPDKELRFNFKEATEDINEIIGDEVLGCACLLSFPKNAEGRQIMRMNCWILDKKPKVVNGKIHKVTLVEVNFG